MEETFATRAPLRNVTSTGWHLVHCVAPSVHSHPSFVQSPKMLRREQESCKDEAFYQLTQTILGTDGRVMPKAAQRSVNECLKWPGATGNTQLCRSQVKMHQVWRNESTASKSADESQQEVVCNRLHKGCTAQLPTCQQLKRHPLSGRLGMGAWGRLDGWARISE